MCRALLWTGLIVFIVQLSSSPFRWRDVFVIFILYVVGILIGLTLLGAFDE